MSGSGGVMHWAPPAPSMASLPVDQSKTEPKPAYYKLQFGDDYSGFSYYVRTLAVMIGRNCEKSNQPPPPAIPDPSVPSIPPLGEDEASSGDVKQESGEENGQLEAPSPPLKQEGEDDGHTGDVTVKVESGISEEPSATSIPAAPEDQAVEAPEAIPIATVSDEVARQDIAVPATVDVLADYLNLPPSDVVPVNPEVASLDAVIGEEPPPPPPPPPPPEKNIGPVEHVDVDLGPLKSVSRNHAKIEYRSDLGHFCLEIYGRNGAWVDDRYYVKGSTVPLNQGSHIQIATRIFSFVLPPSPGGSPYDSSYESGAFEDLPYPYNLPPAQVGYAEFYGEGGPGPSSVEAYAARAAAAAAAAAAQAEVPAIRPFNAFAAPDGHGLGIEMDERWLRDWNGSDSSGLGSSDDADSFDSSSDLSEGDSEDEESDEEDDSDEEEDDDEDENEDESEEEERPDKRGPPRIKLTLKRGTATSSTEVSGADEDGEEEVSSSMDEDEEEDPTSPVAPKRSAANKKPSKMTKKGAAMAAAAAKRLAAAEAAAKKPSAVKAAVAAKAEAKAKGKKSKAEEASESETVASVKGDGKKAKKTVAKKEPKKSSKSSLAPSDSISTAAPDVKPDAPLSLNDALAKAAPTPTTAPARPAPNAPAVAPRPAQPAPLPRPIVASQNSNTSASSEPQRPFYLTELIETPGRPGHIVVNVPIPPSGAGPRPPPGPLIGLDGNHFIGPPPVKPICTFATIIFTALQNLPRGRGTLGEVCNWVAGEWEWFRLNVDAGWQNSIRHNLSLNKAFLKVPRIPEDDPESKGSVWVIDPEEGPLFEERQKKDPGKIGDKIKTAEKRERDRQKVEERIKKQREQAAEAHAAQRVIPAQATPHPHPHAGSPAVRPIAPGAAPHPVAATPGAGPAPPRPIPQRAQPPVPPKPVLAPKTKITVTVTPLTPALRAKTIIASTDAAGNPMPFVCDGQALYLDPSSFGHLTEELISKLSTLGASGAVDVLSGWLSNKNKQKAAQAKTAAATAAANAAKGGAAVRPVNGATPATAAGRLATVRPGAPGVAGKPATPIGAKPGVAAARPPAVGAAVRPPAPGAKPANGSVPPKKPTGPPPPGAHLIPIISRIAEAANSGGDVNAVGPHASALLRYIRHVGVNIEMAVAERIWQTGVVPPLPKKVVPLAKSVVGTKPNGVAPKPAAPGATDPATARPTSTSPTVTTSPMPNGAANGSVPPSANGQSEAPVNGVKRKAEDQASAPAVAEAEAKKVKVDAPAVATT